MSHRILSSAFCGLLLASGCGAGAPAGQEPAGFATILTAPPLTPPAPGAAPGPSPTERLAQERGVSTAEAEAMMNPDEATARDARALDQRLKREAGDAYVGMRIVRDPSPRFAFQFRRDGAATLARFTRDPRFVPTEGGVSAAELQPLFDEWSARFAPHRAMGAGMVSEFEGVVRFDMTIDKAEYDALAAREGWVLPQQVRLTFPSPQNPRSVDPSLTGKVKVFAREDRKPAVTLQALLRGRLILRDGCFRLQDHVAVAGEPLVLFGRDVELRPDAGGHMVVVDPASGQRARVGEPIVWSGPRGAAEADAGVKALRAACGAGPVVAVGEPESAAVFEARTARR